MQKRSRAPSLESMKKFEEWSRQDSRVGLIKVTARYDSPEGAKKPSWSPDGRNPRDGYLLKMPASDYLLPFHAVVQHGDRESSLKKRAVIPLDKQSGRDQTSYLKGPFMYMNKQRDERIAKREWNEEAMLRKRRLDLITVAKFKGCESLLPPELKSLAQYQGRPLEHSFDPAIVGKNLAIKESG